MEDLGEALNVNPDLLFLGGGNPASIPEFEALAAKHMKAIANDQKQLHKLIGVYQSPQGSEEFIAELVKYFQQQCGWDIRPGNIAITNGSQSAFFSLINMLAGDCNGKNKEILFPMMPEYLGYSDQGVGNGMFRGTLPKISLLDGGFFKYQVDFDSLNVDGKTAALCVSRPTNPTGNMLTEAEMLKLNDLANQHDIPLIVDCAYGNPFPGLVYESLETFWNQKNILVLSLSKLGLPGARTGIVIANEEIIQKVATINTILNLASGSFGPGIMTAILKSGELPEYQSNTLLPFYRDKRDFMCACIEKHLPKNKYRIHKPEGAFFLWLWFDCLPICSSELYQRLKEKGVLVMDGSHFFFGVENYEHANQCLRLSYCQSHDVIERAIQIIGDELRSL